MSFWCKFHHWLHCSQWWKFHQNEPFPFQCCVFYKLPIFSKCWAEDLVNACHQSQPLPPCHSEVIATFLPLCYLWCLGSWQLGSPVDTEPSLIFVSNPAAAGDMAPTIDVTLGSPSVTPRPSPTKHRTTLAHFLSGFLVGGSDRQSADMMCWDGRIVCDQCRGLAGFLLALGGHRSLAHLSYWLWNQCNQWHITRGQSTLSSLPYGLPNQKTRQSGLWGKNLLDICYALNVIKFF